MKRKFLRLLFLALLVDFGKAQSSDSLQGAWQLVSYDHGHGLKKTGRETQEIKVISAKHFLWATFDPAKHKTLASGHGPTRLPDRPTLNM